MTQLRIGDAERDSAVERLGEHFAAGRLTKDEFDERATKATQARYEDDLRPLFADLPGRVSPEMATVEGRWPGARSWDARQWISRGRSGSSSWPVSPPFHPMLLVPLFLLAMAAVSFVLFAGPWLLIPLIWIAMAGGGKHQSRRRRQYHGHGHHHRGDRTGAWDG